MRRTMVGFLVALLSIALLAFACGGEEEVAKEAPAAPAPAAPKAPAPKARKLSYKDQRELDELPTRIAALEAEQAAITARLADPRLYADESAQVPALHQRHAQIDDELLAALERWEALG